MCLILDENRRKNLENGGIDLAIRRIRQYDGKDNELSVIRAAIALLLNAGANDGNNSTYLIQLIAFIIF